VPLPYGGHSQVGTYNSQSGPNTSKFLAHLWNLQANPQPSGGKPSQTNVSVPPNYGQPYLGSLNPTWGPNVQSNTPFQGNIPNQPNPTGYMPPHQQPTLPRSSHYMKTAYGPTGIPMRLPTQSH
jgi:hypothetical protein